MLCDIARTKNLRAFHLVKIKSHQQLDLVDDDLALYHAYGNSLADEVASKGTQPQRSAFHEAAHNVAAWYLLHFDLLKEFRAFLIQAHQHRFDAWNDPARKSKTTTTFFSLRFTLESGFVGTLCRHFLPEFFGA